jgi:hypothetical protein
MESEFAQSCSQEPSSGPYHDPDQTSHIALSYISKMYFNIIHPPTAWSY